MNNLEKLQADLSSARQAYEKCQENIKDTTEEVNRQNQELLELNHRADEVAQLLNNAKNYANMSLSMDELTSLKKELEGKNERILDLKDFITMAKNTIPRLNSSSSGASRHVRSLIDEIANVIADNAALEVVSISSTKLKELAYTEMSLQGVSFQSTSLVHRPVFYQKLGERLCKQLFNDENESLVLPTLRESMAERDGLIENLA